MISEEMIVAPLAIIAVFGTLGLGIYMFFTSRHKERMSLIETGQSADIFNMYKRVGSSALKWGLLLLGIGCGIVAGMLLDAMGAPEGPDYFAPIFIFGGLALVIYNRTVRNREKENL